ncbi:helix-turn-helix transcriptional regulator [Azoarcus sp. DN11]|uniref:helix-turn-helix domain-containing protein n=1 Tax=Azoarcus sp. DN11 TaxID=356837 RepID=UPI000EADE366|nr:helix-turn-helix transcriptional regulator [Azoarcus sp. DN11]AYH42720.1 hypothetical protein CDA09_04865 [Azoarcus sp. DN11]
MNNDEKQELANLLQEPERGIAERLRQRRKELDLSVEELSVLTSKFEYASAEGISVPTLYRYEKGDRLPGARELRLLSDSLNVSPNWLILGHEWDSDLQEDADIGRKLLALLGTATARERLPNRSANRDFAHGIKMGQVKEKKEPS